MGERLEVRTHQIAWKIPFSVKEEKYAQLPGYKRSMALQMWCRRDSSVPSKRMHRL